MKLERSNISNGIIQPLILKKDKGEYVIVAGERRWRAAKTIGVKEVPAVVMGAWKRLKYWLPKDETEEIDVCDISRKEVEDDEYL